MIHSGEAMRFRGLKCIQNHEDRSSLNLYISEFDLCLIVDDSSVVDNFLCFRYDNVDLSRPPRHWVDPSVPSAGRFSFLLSRTGSSYLQIQAVASREEGLYRCRVDYDHHQTLIWWSHLDIVGKSWRA